MTANEKKIKVSMKEMTIEEAYQSGAIGVFSRICMYCNEIVK